MESILIFSIVIFILLYFLYNTIHKNLEFFQNSDFEFDIDYFNKLFDIKRKNPITNRKLFEGDYDSLYYQTPFKNNSLLLNNTYDIGILRNLRTNKKFNSYGQEIEYQDLDKINNEITNLGEFNLNFEIDKYDETQTNKILEKISELIVEKINYFFKKLDLEIENHKFDKRKFKYLKYNIISDNEIKNLTKENRNLLFNLIIYRDMKMKHFTIQIDCDYNYIFNKINIKKIDIIGIQNEENLEFIDYKKPKLDYCVQDEKYLNKLNYLNEENDLKLGNNNLSCYPNLNPNNLNLQKYEDYFNENIETYFKNKKKQEENYKEYQKNKCFLKKGFNESTCKSYDYEKGVHGVWDKPCKNNYECPFYKKNKNYVNERGGCINGYCEMPINIERVGYKYYKNNTKPFCYKCNIPNCRAEECFTCCDEQKNREKYPDLKSPHYIFSNDINDI